MGRSVVLGAVVALAIGGAAFLLLREKPNAATQDESAGSGDGATAPAVLPGMGDAAAGGAGMAAGETGKSGVLAAAGRHPERAGTGGARARVVRASGHEPIEGAKVTLRGTSYAGGAVEVSVATNAKGEASLAKVAAGSGYLAVVEAAGEPSVEVPDVEVKAGRSTDLGDLLVGPRVDLVGRVVDEKGHGIAGADVRAIMTFSNPMEMFGNIVDLFTSLGREPTALARDKSGADGSFRLAGLAPGAVAIRASAPGRKQALASVRISAETPPSQTLVLAPGATVAGTVVEERGTPVPRVTVAIMTQEGMGPTDFFAGRVFTTTDDRGRFEAVVDPKASKLRAIVEAADYPTTMGSEFEAGATDVKVVVVHGAEVEVSVLAEGTEEPIPNVSVALMVGETEAGFDSGSSGALSSGVTDSHGIARVPSRAGFLEGLIVTDAVHGMSMLSTKDGRKGPNGGVTGDLPSKIAGGTTKLTLHVKNGVTMTGTVKTSTGAPVAGAEVKSLALFAKGGGTGGTTTDATGAFSLAVQGSSMFGDNGAMIVVRAPGFVKKSEQVAIDDAARQTGTLRHDVTLEPSGTVRGKVVDADGKPVAGAKVRYASGSASFDYGDVMEMMSSGGEGGPKTDATGAYVLPDVATATGDEDESAAPLGPPDAPPRKTPHRATVTVNADGFVAAKTDPFEVRAGTDVTAPIVRLSRGAVLRGVVREPGGRAADGATIEVHVDADVTVDDTFNVFSGMAAKRTVTCDADGHFEVKTLPAGKVTLTASKPGTAASRRTAKVESDHEPSPVEIALRSTSELHGTVLDAEGKPRAAAQVSIEGSLVGRDGDDAYVEPVSTKTDAQGRFTLASLPPGSVSVTVQAEGHVASHTQAPTSGTVEIRLEAMPAGTAARLAAIDQEIADASKQYMGAKDDAERNAAMKRLTALQQEKTRLKAPPSPQSSCGEGKCG